MSATVFHSSALALVARAEKAEEELRATEQQPVVPQKRRWLVAESSGKLHREGSCAKNDPAFLWRCGCGWEFDLSVNYQFVSEEQAVTHKGSFCNGGCDLT